MVFVIKIRNAARKNQVMIVIGMQGRCHDYGHPIYVIYSCWLLTDRDHRFESWLDGLTPVIDSWQRITAIINRLISIKRLLNRVWLSLIDLNGTAQTWETPLIQIIFRYISFSEHTRLTANLTIRRFCFIFRGVS
jgi:hypothetical protein